ncbi:Tetratricopeptide repeat protein [Sulfidibacter corallicola]|uniref:Tetratricopeptide repeat protein n=1 Tax=Sulfidibacter corallicola TaxID=2818388 RepID=A0A8A4TPV4_SULCO|nr:tetratricopeptide repeat protein [Sulfidibacter corallicola]QTD51112.1 tetratricopeptide repeat protein [Sulfidibacter corallicola]
MDEQEKEFLSLLGYFYLRNHKIDKAGILFRALLELYPNDAYLQRALAYTYLQQGKFEQCLLMADRFLDNPGSGSGKTEAFFIKSKALWGLGREDSARAMLNRYIEERQITDGVEPEPNTQAEEVSYE